MGMTLENGRGDRLNSGSEAFTSGCNYPSSGCSENKGCRCVSGEKKRVR